MNEEQLRQEENGSGEESDSEENWSGGESDSNENGSGEESDSEENGSGEESDSEKNGSGEESDSEENWRGGESDSKENESGGESDPEENRVEGESDSQENGEKLSKRVKGDLVDRLSSLPEPLLIHILTRLGSMEKAISTSVLSKRWKCLWTDLPDLRFSDSSNRIQGTLKFVTQVHRAVSLRTVKSLVRLEIRFVYKKCFASDVNVWIEFALKQKVKYLVLRLGLWTGIFYTLPQEIYSSPSLENLNVRECIVEPHESINWKNLTKLEIEDVELHEDVIQKILSGCPVLRDLGLTLCWGFKCLHINSKSLDRLSVQEREEEEEDNRTSLEISAPYLRFLCVGMFNIYTKDLRIKNIQSLVEADISFTESPSSVDVVNNVMEIFGSIQHVNKLEIGWTFVKILSEVVASGFQLPLSPRESLIIVADRDGTISAILDLLESSPHLESLILDCYEDYGNAVGLITKQDLDWDLKHLKTVHLLDYADPNSAGEPMLTLARVLLKRATVLENMVVDAKGNLTKHSPDDSAEIAQTLLTYPKTSQKATITFIP